MDIETTLTELGAALNTASDKLNALRPALGTASPDEASPRRQAPSAALDSFIGYLALSPGMAEDHLLNTLLSCAMNLVRAAGAALLLYDAERGVLVFKATVGVAADKIIDQDVPLENTQLGMAFRTRQVIASTPLSHSIDALTGTRYTSILAAPLMVNEEPVGLISAVNKLNQDHFTPEDIIAYSNFAELAAHIVQQRQRESALKRWLAGETMPTPKEFEDLDRAPLDPELFLVASEVAAIGRESPERLRLCRQIIGLIANLDR